MKKTLLNKKDDSVNLTLTPEQSLELMKGASNTFYQLAALTQCHPFLEFTGILNEYIKICEENYKLKGIDFREENIHTGKNQMVIADYMIDYINEKLECIFQGLIVMDREDRIYSYLHLDKFLAKNELRLSNGKRLICKNSPSIIPISKRDELFVAYEPKIGINCYEYTGDGLLKEIHEDLKVLWEEYALECTDNLTTDAIQLKDNLLNYFMESEEDTATILKSIKW